MGFFKRKNKEKNALGLAQKTTVKALNYPPKIILAWAKVIEGNKDLMTWLSQNGYEELTVCYWALVLKNDARQWLTDNGFSHLMAFVSASEGNENAKNWLNQHGFALLYHMAMAVDGEEKDIAWLMKNSSEDILLLTQTIKRLKDRIEENHNDVHSFGID